MTMIHHIPEPPKPNDDWSAAYLVQDRQVTNLLAAPIERLIEQRGGWLFGPDGARERPTVMGVTIDVRA